MLQRTLALAVNFHLSAMPCRLLEAGDATPSVSLCRNEGQLPSILAEGWHRTARDLETFP
jgi:hypothetical protein